MRNVNKITLLDFNNFLKSIDLNKNRNTYKNIKSFEADMNKDIQALESIYKTYWEQPILPLPNFKNFFDNHYFIDPLKTKAINFNKSRIGLCDVCFNKGIEARIYRTWASLITQIQGAYAAVEIFGRENVFQSVELDHTGIDIMIKYRDKRYGIQVKKKTGRREIINRKPEPKENKFVDVIIPLWYFVPTEKDWNNPCYLKNGDKYKKGDFKPMAELFGLDGKDAILNKLNNGFVVFTTNFFKNLKNLIDKSK